MKLTEAYDLINNKYIKSNNNYYHYVSIDKFHNMIKDNVIYTGSYPANTFDYGKKNKNGYELCVVRSDRRPDLVDHLQLSGSVGDIKIFFNEENMKNDFGKPKHIDEYPVQGIQYMNRNLIKRWKNNIKINVPKIHSLLDDFSKNFMKWNEETTSNKYELLKKFVKTENGDLREIKYCQEQYKSEPEHMESRFQLKNIKKLIDGKNIPLTKRYVEKILIPDYLKDEKQVLEDLKKLKVPYEWYKCKFPKEIKGEDY